MLCKTEGLPAERGSCQAVPVLAGVLPACVTPVSVWKRGCYVVKTIDKKQGELYVKHSSVVWFFALFHSFLVICHLF